MDGFGKVETDPLWVKWEVIKTKAGRGLLLGSRDKIQEGLKVGYSSPGTRKV